MQGRSIERFHVNLRDAHSHARAIVSLDAAQLSGFSQDVRLDLRTHAKGIPLQL